MQQMAGRVVSIPSFLLVFINKGQNHQALLSEYAVMYTAVTYTVLYMQLQGKANLLLPAL